MNKTNWLSENPHLIKLWVNDGNIHEFSNRYSTEVYAYPSYLYILKVILTVTKL